MQMSPQYNPHQFDQLEEKTLNMTSKMVQDAQTLLMLVRQRAASLSEQNKISAAQYVSGIRDTLKEYTNVGIQRTNQIVLDKIRDVENNLISFSLIIDQEVDSYVKDVGSDIRTFQSRVATAESRDASQVLEAALEQVDHEIRSLVNDIDQLYSSYRIRVCQAVEYYMRTATDQISILLNGQRRNSNCCIPDRVDVCYNISVQNDVVHRSLGNVLKMINFVHNTTQAVEEVEDIFAGVDPNSVTKFEASKTALEETMNDGRQTINSILSNDYLFLGSAVRELGYEDHVQLQEFIIRSMKTVIHSLVRSLQTSMDNFEVVKPVEHCDKLVAEIREDLESFEKEVKSKASLIADAVLRAEFESKANLTELKDLLNFRFANVTHVVNGAFSEDRHRLTGNLRFNLAHIGEQQLPYISSLTLQNYIPTDVCPVALDYQKYISTAIQGLDKSDNDLIADLFQSANYVADDVLSEDALELPDFDYIDSLAPPTESESIPQESGVETSNGISTVITNLLMSALLAISNAGNNLEESDRTVINDK